MMATGTVAGALDESFNNDSVLELWHLSSPDDTTTEVTPSVVSSISTSARFNRLGWGFAHKDKPYGLLAAGLENGEVGLWDVGMMLNPSTTSQSQVLRNTMHKGSVRGLSFNQPQPNLIATGSVNAEIYVWDLKAPGKPYTPGARSQHLDEISSLAWNGQVPYVLATASTNGCTTVWDLRHKREIAVLRNMTAGGPMGAAAGSARSISSLAWHPLSPTRIVTATEDDMNPGIVLWDLRNSRAPETVLQGHEQGVLGLSWCKQDENLLLSCGKDSRTLCWNPQSHEIVAEMPPRANWAFDVQWNPRNPNMLATSSFDGHIMVQSLQDTQVVDEHQAPADTANMNPDDLFNALGNAPPPTTGGMPLVTAPKWLKRPVSVSFGFGGQLVRIPKPVPGARNAPIQIMNVRTEPHIAVRAQNLSDALDQGTLQEFCAAQSHHMDTRPADVANWKALQTLFQAESRDELVELLGFSKDVVSARIQEAVNALGPSLLEDDTQEAALAGQTEQAAETTEQGDPAAFFDKLPSALPPPPMPVEPFRLHPGGDQDPDRLVTQALILGDFESAVSLLVSQDRFADALVLATRAGDELLVKTQRAYFKRHASRLPYLRLLQSIIMEDLSDVVLYADLSEWQEIFVVLCTFAEPEDFHGLAEQLGQRLEDRYLQSVQSGMGREALDDRKNAVLCYLAAGRLEKVMSMWIDEMKEEEQALKQGAGHEEDSQYSAHAEALQTFMEKVVVFQQAVQYTDEDLQPPPMNEDGTVPYREFKLAPLYDYILEYVNVLAEQGLVDVALKFVALTPSDYVPVGGVGNAEWAHDRLLRASEASGYTYDQGAYTQPGSSNDAYGHSAYTQSTYGSTALDAPPKATSAPLVPTVPTIPTVPSVPTVPAVPPVSTVPTVPEPTPSPYAPNYDTTAPVDNTTAATGYNSYSASTIQAPPPPPPMISAPPSGAANVLPDTASMPPPPPAIKRDQGGWNDVPTSVMPPKRSPAPPAAAAITAPFPNQAMAPPPQASMPPPPPRGPPSGPPPSSMPPPPSPRTGLGIGQPPMAGRGMDPSRMGPDGAAYMRPQTPSAPGRPLRAQVTGPPSQFAGQAMPNMAPRGVSQGTGMPPTPQSMPGPPQARVPPRSQTPAGGGYGAPPPPSTPHSKPGFQYPRGDRSHIPPNLKGVADILAREIQRLRSIDAQPTRLLDDAERRVQLLLDLFNNGLIDGKMVPVLQQLGQALGARNQQGALSLHVQLVTMASGDIATALVGVKFLIAKLSS